VGKMMLYEVDFAIKLNGSFSTVHTEYIFAHSVSECQDRAEEILQDLPQNKNHHVHIFIEA
jgi:hypothetical protein